MIFFVLCSAPIRKKNKFSAPRQFPSDEEGRLACLATGEAIDRSLSLSET
jgi:hypothetical protein